MSLLLRPRGALRWFMTQHEDEMTFHYLLSYLSSKRLRQDARYNAARRAAGAGSDGTGANGGGKRQGLAAGGRGAGSFRKKRKQAKAKADFYFMHLLATTPRTARRAVWTSGGGRRWGNAALVAAGRQERRRGPKTDRMQ